MAWLTPELALALTGAASTVVLALLNNRATQQGKELDTEKEMIERMFKRIDTLEAALAAAHAQALERTVIHPRGDDK